MNNQNESPFGNPRFVIAIIAVFFALWGWQYYINKKYPQPVAPTQVASANQKQSKTTNEIEKINAQAVEKIAATEDKNKTEKIFSYEDEQTKWQVSSFGMGLNEIVLKKYFDKSKNPIVFKAQSGLFTAYANDRGINFDIKQTGEAEFVGSAEVDGGSLTRTLKYNKETHSFESTTTFDSAIDKLSFYTGEPQHQASGGNFLMPSFDFQNFLYKEKDKVKTEDILHRQEGEVFKLNAPASPLAAISSQYFTQSYLDKSEVLPDIDMQVAGKAAKMNVTYNLKDTKINKIENKIYIGPKLSETLAQIDPILPEVMDYGIFGFIAKPLLVLMKFLFGVFGNWGVAIIALTIVMRLIMLPFNIVSFKSARAMQKIQPQLQAVREKYKNDPMAVNRETMALMKEHNANPLSSCLPMLIQIPVFFALWKTIGSSIEIYQQPFFGWITDLSSHDKFFVLPILMGITMFFQQKMTPTTMDPMQAKILNFMPLLFSVFMLSLPSGLTLYNFISSLFGVVQQYFLLKDNKK